MTEHMTKYNEQTLSGNVTPNNTEAISNSPDKRNMSFKLEKSTFQSTVSNAQNGSNKSVNTRLSTDRIQFVSNIHDSSKDVARSNKGDTDKTYYKYNFFIQIVY